MQYLYRNDFLDGAGFIIGSEAPSSTIRWYIQLLQHNKKERKINEAR
jgi:hypothetical protein